MPSTQIDLRDLDDANDAHWTEAGEPRLSVVRQLSVIDNLTREDIRAMGRVRNKATKEPAAPAAPMATEGHALDTAEAVNIAETVLQNAHRRVYAARADLKLTLARLADAVTAFQNGPKRTVADLVRENSARERARKLAVIRGEIEPDTVAAIQPASHLDAVLQSGRGGSINLGYRRPPARLPKALPWQR